MSVNVHGVVASSFGCGLFGGVPHNRINGGLHRHISIHLIFNCSTIVMYQNQSKFKIKTHMKLSLLSSSLLLLPRENEFRDGVYVESYRISL